MTFFSRLVLTGSIALSVAFLSGCASEQEDPSLFPTLENTAPKDRVARFQVGDELTITLQGPQEEIPPHVEAINDDGSIHMPEIGAVQAKGTTPGELASAIHDLYVPKYYNQLTVAVSSSERVYYVNGEVKAPARQLYLGETTVTKAITTAGDFTDFANHSRVLLIRGNHKIKVDCTYILDHPEKDPLVFPGDSIRVSRRTF